LVISHIAFFVKDLDKSTRFYTDVLQLQSVPEPFKDGLHTWFQIGPGCQLHLIGGSGESVKQHINTHLAFTTDAILPFVDRLTKAGFSYSDAFGNKNIIHTRPDGIQQVFFRDPDGYWIEVNNDVEQA
jgi:lactoylglutathione lyase